MYESEYEVIKRSLERLGKIEDSCQKTVDEHFERKEIEMYHAAKAFVEEFDAKSAATRNRHMRKQAMNALDNAAGRDDEDGEDE